MAINFDAKNFLEEKSYPAIQVGEHDVVLGAVSVGNDIKDGEDNVYIVLPITLNNGRVIETRFYGQGIQIVRDQLRQQVDDRNVYETNLAFFKSLEGKTLKCWISKRSYTGKDGKDKNTLQYDFVNRTKATVVAIEDNDTEEDLII